MTAAEPTATLRTSSARERLTTWLASGRGVTSAAVGMVVLHLAFRAWALYGSWFRFDDANFVSHLSGNDLSPSIALTGYASHLMPGAFILTWLNAKLGTLAWVYPATELLALQALAAAGAVVFLISAFGRRPGILPPLAIYLFTVITVPATISWGPGITQVPFLAVIFWGGCAHLQYLRTRRFRWAVATMAVTVLGTMFGEKTLLVFWLYAFLPIAYFASGDLFTRLRDVVRRYLAGIVLYSVVVIGYVAWYVLAAMNFDPSDSAAVPLLPLAGNLVGASWATGVLGGPLRWSFQNGVSAGIAAPGQLVIVAAIGILIAVGYEIDRSRARSKRAWLLLALILCSDVLTIASARATFTGPQIALLYRYLTETAAITAIAIALATMPLIGAPEQVERREPGGQFIDRPRRVTVAMLVVVMLGTWSSATYVHRWHADKRTKNYFATAHRALKAAKGPVPLVDSGVPSWLIWGLAYPDNMVSHVLKPYDELTRFPSIASDSLYMIADDGSVSPVVINTVRRNVLGSSGKCPYPVRDQAITVPLDGPAVGIGWWVRLAYYSPAAAELQISAGDNRYVLEAAAGLHSVFFKAEGELFDQIRLDGFDSGSGFCVTELQLGRPRPFQKPSPQAPTS